MVLSFPSPHGPEDAAPPYQHMFQNVTTHRTPNWNHAPNPDKQWLLRNTGKMEDIHIQFTDMLHMKRLQTLQSVDDAVDRLYRELKELDELDNTFIFYTSDHGYHLGQFGLVKGKSMPFEFDVRVPFYVRGPRVPAGVRIRDITLNLDLAPTFLDIGGVDIPEHMDGKSILPLLKDAYNWVGSGHSHGEVKRKKSWRDSFLLERGAITPATWKAIMGNVVLPSLRPKLTKDERLSVECQNEEFSSPCKPYQKWECFHDGYRWRIRKCRMGFSLRGRNQNNCICPNLPETGSFAEAKERMHSEFLIRHNKNIKKMDPEERRLQRQFLKEHVNKDFKPIFIGSRARRDVSGFNIDEFDVNGILHLSQLLDLTVDTDENNFVDADVERWLSVNASGLSRKKRDKLLKNAKDQILDVELTWMQKGSVNAEGCVILPNSSVMCDDEIYRDPQLWRQKKDRLDNVIKRLREKLDELKGIRRHLKKSRPLPHLDLSVVDNTKFQDRQCHCLPNHHIDQRKQLDLEWKQERDTSFII